MDNIVDDEFQKKLDTNPEREAFSWWEKRRLYYNLVVGLAGLIGLWMSDLPVDIFTIAGCFLWAIFANISYSLGFLLEMVNQHYMDSVYRLENYRNLFLVIGCIFSMLASLVFPSIVYFESANF